MQDRPTEFECDTAEALATPTRHRRPFLGMLCVGIAGLFVAWPALILTVVRMWDDSFCQVVFAVVSTAAVALVVIGIQYARGVNKGLVMAIAAFVLFGMMISIFVLFFVILPELKPPDRDDVLPQLREKRGTGGQLTGKETGTRPV